MSLNDILGEKISVLTNTKFIKKENIEEGMKILIRPIPQNHTDLRTKTPINYRGKNATVIKKMDNGLRVRIDGNINSRIIDYVDVSSIE